MADLLARQPCPTDLASDLDLLLGLPGEDPIRMRGALRAAWPDRIRLQVRLGAFWPVASIAVGSDSAFVSLPRLKGYWAGSLTSGWGANPAALASTLLWLLCPGPLAGGLEEPILERSGEGWMLRGRLGRGDAALRCELRLPEKHGEIQEITFRDGEGEILLRAWRLGGRDLAGALLPEAIRLQVGLPAVRFEARILSPREDREAAPGTFRIARPPGSRVIPEEELLEMFGAAGRGR